MGQKLNYETFLLWLEIGKVAVLPIAVRTVVIRDQIEFIKIVSPCLIQTVIFIHVLNT